MEQQSGTLSQKQTLADLMIADDLQRQKENIVAEELKRQMHAMKKDIEALREENRKLREELEQVKNRVNSLNSNPGYEREKERNQRTMVTGGNNIKDKKKAINKEKDTMGSKKKIQVFVTLIDNKSGSQKSRRELKYPMDTHANNQVREEYTPQQEIQDSVRRKEKGSNSNKKRRLI